MNARTEFALGLIADMPPEQYHAINAMSAGGLKRMRQTPAHFYGLQLDPTRPPSEPTPAMRNGTLVHTAVFEPDQVAKRYVVRPEGLDGRTKEGKAWAAEHADREIVDRAQMEAALAQGAAIRGLPDVAALLSDGMGEASAFWIDEATGELCKCRPDWTSPVGDGVVLVDGKTCVDASAEGFGRSVVNFAYDLQAVHYTEGFERATGKKVHGFVFAVVESSWPHAAAAYMLGDEWLAAAARQRRRLIDLYASCRKLGKWPGYEEGVQLLQPPRWLRLGDMA